MAKGTYNNRLLADAEKFTAEKKTEKPVVLAPKAEEPKAEKPVKKTPVKKEKKDRKADLFTKTLELPKDLAKKAKEAAELQGISLNTFIKNAVENELKNNEEKYQKIREFKEMLK